MMKIIDKRRNRRIKTKDFHIDYRHQGEKKIYTVETINISYGGICFLRNSIVKSDDVLEIKFPFKEKKIIIDARVIRVQGREVAAAFTGDEKKMEKIIDLYKKEYK